MSELWRTVTVEQIKFVDDLALQHVTARTNDGSRTTNGQPMEFERRLRDTRNGYRAEAAARLWFGREVPWTIMKKVYGEPDFAGFIDVKARQKTHHKLPITPDCLPEYAYLLVCGARHPDYQIIGWCWGHEAMQDDYWNDPGTGRPAWWVAADDPIMKPPHELMDEIRKRQNKDRAGFVGYDSKGRFVAYCRCGAYATQSFSTGTIRDGEFGTWFCYEHLPRDASPMHP